MMGKLWTLLVCFILAFLTLSLNTGIKTFHDHTIRGQTAYPNGKPIANVKLDNKSSIFHANLIPDSGDIFTCRDSILSHEYKDNGSFQEVESMELFIRSAFLDTRRKWPVILVIGIGPQHVKSVQCHLGYDSGQDKDVIIAVNGTVETFFKTSRVRCYFQMVFIKCPVPKEITYKINSVSLAKERCKQLSNKLDVTYTGTAKRKPKQIAICMSTMFNKTKADIRSFVEFMELHKILGYHQVILYDAVNVDNAFKRALEFYAETGFLVIEPWNLPVPTEIRKDQTICRSDLEKKVYYHAQITAYNDCLYRYMDTFSYIAPIDEDEVIISKTPIIELLEQLSNVTKNNQKAGSFYFQEHRFCTSRSEDKGYSDITDVSDVKLKGVDALNWRKMIIKPELVTRLAVHDVRSFISENYGILLVDKEMAMKYHYAYRGKRCAQKKTGNDTTMMKYHRELEGARKAIMKKIII